EPRHCPHPAELISSLVGEDGLVDAVHQCSTGQEGDLLIVINHQHLDRLLPGRNKLEALQACEYIEVDIPCGAEPPEVLNGCAHGFNKRTLLFNRYLAGLAPHGVDR